MVWGALAQGRPVNPIKPRNQRLANICAAAAGLLHAAGRTEGNKK